MTATLPICVYLACSLMIACRSFTHARFKYYKVAVPMIARAPNAQNSRPRRMGTLIHALYVLKFWSTLPVGHQRPPYCLTHAKKTKQIKQKKNEKITASVHFTKHVHKASTQQHAHMTKKKKKNDGESPPPPPPPMPPR